MSWLGSENSSLNSSCRWGACRLLRQLAAWAAALVNTVAGMQRAMTIDVIVVDMVTYMVDVK